MAGPPTVVARNSTPVAYPGSPLHLSVEFCANPPAFAARWLHGDRVYTPGNQYGIDVLAYGVIVSTDFFSFFILNFSLKSLTSTLRSTKTKLCLHKNYVKLIDYIKE